MRPLTAVLVGVTVVLLPTVAAQSQDQQPRNGNPAVTSGYQSKVLINRLSVPRHIALDTEGNLLVAEQGNPGYLDSCSRTMAAWMSAWEAQSS